jgi:hypothetical protein
MGTGGFLTLCHQEVLEVRIVRWKLHKIIKIISFLTNLN